MGSALGAWSALQRRRQIADQRQPVTNLVKSLIGLQERRDEKDRLARAEERQGRLDEQFTEELRRKQEWEDFERKSLVASGLSKWEKQQDQEVGTVETQPTMGSVKIREKKGPDGTVETQTDKQIPIGTMKTTDRGSFEWTGDDWSKIADVDPEILATSKPAIAGEADEILPLIQQQYAERDPMTAGLQGKEYELPFLEEANMIRRLRSLASPAGVQAQIYGPRGQRPSTEEVLEVFERKEQIKAKYKGTGAKDRWELRNTDQGLVRIDPDSGDYTVVIPKSSVTGKPLKPPPDSLLKEMGEMKALASKTKNLAELESDYTYELAKWTPNIIRNALSGRHSDETDNFFMKFQKYDPAYFMYTAAVLKAVQGSRPSDRDMEWYLQNMPRMHDRPETKAVKVKWLIDELAGKYNSMIDVFSPYKDMSGFDRMEVPELEEIRRMTGAATGTDEEPPE